MEEKKLDSKTIIGFVLMFILLLWVMYNNQPSEDELVKKKTKTEQTESNLEKEVLTEETILLDSTALAEQKDDFGVSIGTTKEGFTEIENNLIKLKINNKGGQITEMLLKNFKTYDGKPLYLIKDKNSELFLEFTTNDSRTLVTKNMYFQPTITKNNGNQVVSMKLKVSENKFLEYIYELPKDSYMLNYTVRSQGFANVWNTTKPINIHWDMKSRRMDKSVTYEDRYTQLTAQYEGDEITKLSASGEDNKTEKEVSWVAFKQHLFTSILISDVPFASADMTSKNLVTKEDIKAEYTKYYTTKMPLVINGGELNQSMKLYYGPSDYRILNKYKKYDLTASISLGWGIFGWLNRYIFIPLFDFLTKYFSIGIAIIIMTIIVRLVLSPIAYKSYLSQAKMKVLRPEITEINEKYKEPMKRQQETMALYRKAGVNPMSGCIPALLQLPIFLALFNFFPNVFQLRQASFLWADDLSSYDAIYELPFSIPFYGSHISLFPILASLAIFVYTMMTMSQQSQQQQPGMPNMKFMMYLSPLMMLFFFNNYASGLSLYYFISNLITIFIMLAIKYWIIDERKIHAKIQENKKKPKKENRFQRKMREMMEQAEAQKKAQGK